MLSHVSRRDTIRKRTLEQLPVAPIVVESFATSGTDAEVRRKAYECMRHAEGDMVFLEDDLKVNAPLFLRQVERAKNLGEVTVFCLLRKSLYPAWALRSSAPEGLVPMVGFDAYRGFHGTMAVYLPESLVSYALAHPEEFHDNGEPLKKPVVPADFERGKVTGFDFWLKCRARRMFVAIPNPIDHADPPSVHGLPRRSVMKSPAFR